MNRRAFLSTLCVVPLAALMPFGAKPPILAPGIVGDGFADDSAALQAMVDDCARTGQQFELHGGTYRLSTPLDLARLCGGGPGFNIIKLPL